MNIQRTRIQPVRINIKIIPTFISKKVPIFFKCNWFSFNQIKNIVVYCIYNNLEIWKVKVFYLKLSLYISV